MRFFILFKIQTGFILERTWLQSECRCIHLFRQISQWDAEAEDVDLDLPHDLVRWDSGTPGPDVHLDQVCSSVKSLDRC
jgi:hypothetical protein